MIDPARTNQTASSADCYSTPDSLWCGRLQITPARQHQHAQVPCVKVPCIDRSQCSVHERQSLPEFRSYCSVVLTRIGLEHLSKQRVQEDLWHQGLDRASIEGGPETGLKTLDPMLRQLMVRHGVVNKFPKGFCINIVFSHRKSHSELFRMLRMVVLRAGGGVETGRHACLGAGRKCFGAARGSQRGLRVASPILAFQFSIVADTTMSSRRVEVRCILQVHSMSQIATDRRDTRTHSAIAVNIIMSQKELN